MNKFVFFILTFIFVVSCRENSEIQKRSNPEIGALSYQLLYTEDLSTDEFGELFSHYIYVTNWTDKTDFTELNCMVFDDPVFRNPISAIYYVKSKSGYPSQYSFIPEAEDINFSKLKEELILFFKFSLTLSNGLITQNCMLIDYIKVKDYTGVIMLK